MPAIRSQLTYVRVIGSRGLAEIQDLKILLLHVRAALASDFRRQFRQLMKEFEGRMQVRHHLFQLLRKRASQFPDRLLVGCGPRCSNNMVCAMPCSRSRSLRKVASLTNSAMRIDLIDGIQKSLCLKGLP
jgi:hypothetical protein